MYLTHLLARIFPATVRSPALAAMAASPPMYGKLRGLRPRRCHPRIRAGPAETILESWDWGTSCLIYCAVSAKWQATHETTQAKGPCAVCHAVRAGVESERCALPGTEPCHQQACRGGVLNDDGKFRLLAARHASWRRRRHPNRQSRLPPLHPWHISLPRRALLRGQARVAPLCPLSPRT